MSGEFDFEKASGDARTLVLPGAALKAGIFPAISEEMDIAYQALGAFYIVLEALCSPGYVNKNEKKYVIADKSRCFPGIT